MSKLNLHNCHNCHNHELVFADILLHYRISDQSLNVKFINVNKRGKFRKPKPTRNVDTNVPITRIKWWEHCWRYTQYKSYFKWLTNSNEFSFLFNEAKYDGCDGAGLGSRSDLIRSLPARDGLVTTNWHGASLCRRCRANRTNRRPSDKSPI